MSDCFPGKGAAYIQGFIHTPCIGSALLPERGIFFFSFSKNATFPQWWKHLNQHVPLSWYCRYLALWEKAVNVVKCQFIKAVCVNFANRKYGYWKQHKKEREELREQIKHMFGPLHETWNLYYFVKFQYISSDSTHLMISIHQKQAHISSFRTTIRHWFSQTGRRAWHLQHVHWDVSRLGDKEIGTPFI